MKHLLLLAVSLASLGLVFLAKGEEYNCNCNATAGTAPPGEWHRLDEYCDSKCGDHANDWIIQTNFTRLGDWFTYTDSFNAVKGLENAEGVWIAKYREQSPIFGMDYPVIGMNVGVQLRQLEITYYLFKNATIRIHGQGSEIVLDARFNDPDDWMVYSTSKFNDFEIELITSTPEDFVLIDKVIVSQQEFPSTTPGSPPTTKAGSDKPTTARATTRNTMMTSTVATTKLSSTPNSHDVNDDAVDSGVSHPRQAFMTFILFLLVSGIAKF